MMQDSNAVVHEVAPIVIKKSIFFGPALMWQHIQPLRQTIVLFSLVYNKLRHPKTGMYLVEISARRVDHFFGVDLIYLFSTFFNFKPCWHGDQLFSNFFFRALTASSTTLACGLLNPNSSARRSSSFKRPNSLQKMA